MSKRDEARWVADMVARIERKDVVHEVARLNTAFSLVRAELDELRTQVTADAPQEVRAFLDAVPGIPAVHLCFGNYGGQTIQKGSWDKLIRYLNALHADHEFAGGEVALRATLCRCGASQRKPWCDGSHTAAGFTASGEPPVGTFDAVARRNGRITITPLRNGPLLVEGSLELCTGTGKTFAKLGAPNVGEAKLCRCGQSRGKPFCDGSHVAAGFAAEGR